MKRLSYLPFPRNARFVYLQKDFGSFEYWRALIDALCTHTVAYGAALIALSFRGGLVPKSHFYIACGSPLLQKGHVAADAILQRLVKANVLRLMDVPGLGECVALEQEVNRQEPNYSALRARLITEEILLKAVRNWLRNLGMASYDLVAIRDEKPIPPKVGTFAWDLSAPSYLAPMVDRRKGERTKPGFVACDVLLAADLPKEVVGTFIRKCNTLRSLKRVGRCLQFFIAESYAPDALRVLKEEGIVPATPGSLFGEDVAKGLKQLTEALTNAARASENPKIVDELFKRLSSIEGADTNLRGALFEFVVAGLVRLAIGGAQVSMNKVVKTIDGERAEADVMVVSPGRSVTFIECKGYQPASIVDDAEVERWLKKQIPTLKKWVLEHQDLSHLHLRFEFWATGKFTEEGLAALKEASENTKKYQIQYRDAEGVLTFAKEVNDSSLLGTLKEHFLEHPMVTAEKAIAREEKRAAARAQWNAENPPAEPQFAALNANDLF
ncbi:MAG: hypothetical protein CME86_06695 [Herbaspirillum sp.]|nr:hypothetical protein [Herbaspirillum sp.]|tara:strand:- start:3178 stop:4668 length:1491 start_codon:yes stop_codon:yes gene_type:complete